MALNNVGVAMLEQGSFYDAVTVFQDALFVSQMTTTTITPSGEEELLLLHSATCQLAHQKKQPLEQLQICPCDDGDVADMKNMLECISVFVPIRLRSRELYEPQDQGPHTSANSESSNVTGDFLAMVWYNQGLAYLLSHVQDKLKWYIAWDGTPTTTKEHGKTLILGAVTSFLSAHALIHDHLTKSNNQSYETLWILYVLAMVHKALMWLSRLDNQDLQADQAREMLSKVLSDIHNCQVHWQALNASMGGNGDDPSIAAAA